MTPSLALPTLLLESREWEGSEQGPGDVAPQPESSSGPLAVLTWSSGARCCSPALPSSAHLGIPGGSPRPQLFPSRVDGFVLMAGYFFHLFLRMSLKRAINSKL